MKRLITSILICLGVAGSLFAQTDSTYINKYLQLRNLVISAPDSALNESYRLRSGTSSDKGLYHLITGNVMWAQGELPEALRNYYESLSYFEEDENLYALITVYNDISLVEIDETNYPEALEALQKSDSINDIYESPWLKVILTSNIGDLFLRWNQLDSARKYTQHSYDLALQEGDSNLYAFIIKNLGKIELAEGNSESGNKQLSRALTIAINQNDNFHQVDILSDIGDFYLKKGMMDSARIYLHRALTKSREVQSLKKEWLASEKLQLFHQNTGQYDSAYHYSLRTKLLKDSIVGADKVRLIAHYGELEEMRLEEIRKLEEERAESRRNLIQYLIIGMIILLFSSMIFTLRKIKISKFWFEVLLLVTLLMVFEFITLMVHTYAAELTHHSPLLMLLILVAVAAVLGPIHHHSVKYARKVFLKDHLHNES